MWSGKNNISKELINVADEYTDLLDIAEVWGDTLRHREDKKTEHPPQGGCPLDI